MIRRLLLLQALTTAVLLALASRVIEPAALRTAFAGVQLAWAVRVGRDGSLLRISPPEMKLRVLPGVRVASRPC